MSRRRRITVDSPATYEVRVQGHLDKSWSEYMGDVTIRTDSPPDESPVTVVTGEFQDQAALTGALNLLYDLGLPLLSVACIDRPNSLPA